MHAEVTLGPDCQAAFPSHSSHDSTSHLSLPGSEQLRLGPARGVEIPDDLVWEYSCWVLEHCEEDQDATGAPRLFDCAVDSIEYASNLRGVVPSTNQTFVAIDVAGDSTSWPEMSASSRYMASADETLAFGSAESDLLEITASVPQDPCFDDAVTFNFSSASPGDAPLTPRECLTAANSEVDSGSGSAAVNIPVSSSARAVATRRSESKSSARPSPSSRQAPKPFPCPKPNCRKSYQQSNGLRYHTAHGTCSSEAPQDRAPLWKALLANGAATSRRTTAGRAAHESEGDAACSARPYACAVGDCKRRYKNIAGLRYHYFHSGRHGIDGLSLLASGNHLCLALLTGRGRRAAMEQASRALEPLDIDQTARS